MGSDGWKTARYFKQTASSNCSTHLGFMQPFGKGIQFNVRLLYLYFYPNSATVCALLYIYFIMLQGVALRQLYECCLCITCPNIKSQFSQFGPLTDCFVNI